MKAISIKLSLIAITALTFATQNTSQAGGFFDNFKRKAKDVKIEIKKNYNDALYASGLRSPLDYSVQRGKLLYQAGPTGLLNSFNNSIKGLTSINQSIDSNIRTGEESLGENIFEGANKMVSSVKNKARQFIEWIRGYLPRFLGGLPSGKTSPNRSSRSSSARF